MSISKKNLVVLQQVIKTPTVNINTIFNNLKNTHKTYIITFAYKEHGLPITSQFDIQNGVVGYGQYDEEYFRLFLSYLSKDLLSIHVREITDIKIEALAANGEMMLLPIKNIYQVLIKNENIYPIPIDKVKEHCNTDSNMGGRLIGGNLLRYKLFNFQE